MKLRIHATGSDRRAASGSPPCTATGLLVRSGMLCALLWMFVACGGIQTVRAEPPPPPAPMAPVDGSYSLSLRGNAVNFDLSGMEPDFDPIYKLAVTGTLRDLRPAGTTLPEATLVLYSYMEVFQPDTTPILPDLLHPNQTATDLAGFLTGKAALVNVGGKTVYRGSMLAEIFADNTEHLIVDLYPANGNPNAPAIRLQGPVTLHKGGAQDGTLRALAPLSRSALAVPRGRQPSWQAVIAGLAIAPPAMLGTAGQPGQHGPAKGTAAVSTLHPSPPPAPFLTRAKAIVAGGIVLVLAILIGPTIWSRRAVFARVQWHRRAGTPPGA